MSDRCYYCKRAVLHDKFNMQESNAWRWYTGINPPTRHICPECLATPTYRQQFEQFVEDTHNASKKRAEALKKKKL